jgi:hypothetical protein
VPVIEPRFAGHPSHYTELNPHVFQELHLNLFHTYSNTAGITGWYIISQNNAVAIRLDPTMLSSEAA